MLPYNQLQNMQLLAKLHTESHILSNRETNNSRSTATINTMAIQYAMAMGQIECTT